MYELMRAEGSDLKQMFAKVSKVDPLCRRAEGFAQ